jgi:hypothetical protein
MSETGELFSLLSLGDCVRAAKKDARWRKPFETSQKDFLNYAGGEVTLEALDTIVGHSKSVRKKLCQDCDFLDLLSIRAMDCTLFMALDIRQSP